MTQLTTNDTSSSVTNGLALQYLVREPKVKEAKQKGLILLHGVGSNEQDLFSLAPQLPDDCWVITPRGQFTLGAGRYAWYQVDFSTGKPVINAAQEASSREVIRVFINEVKQKYNIAEVYLGGFSQGAIMSYSIGLTHPGEVSGIIALSGRILDDIKPLVQRNADLQQLKVFLAHGVADNTLPIHYAKAAKAYLESLGISLSYHEYEMGHQINSAVVRDMEEWLGK
jgi:phospholipase/carboxylesterase